MNNSNDEILAAVPLPLPGERMRRQVALARLLLTAGGINEQFLANLVEHGLLTRVSEALDAVLHRIGAES